MTIVPPSNQLHPHPQLPGSPGLYKLTLSLTLFPFLPGCPAHTPPIPSLLPIFPALAAPHPATMAGDGFPFSMDIWMDVEGKAQTQVFLVAKSGTLT